MFLVKSSAVACVLISDSQQVKIIMHFRHDTHILAEYFCILLFKILVATIFKIYYVNLHKMDPHFLMSCHSFDSNSKKM